MKHSTLLLLFIHLCAFSGPNNIAIVIDFDDTITTDYRLDISDFVREISYIVPNLTQYDLKNLEEMGRQIVRTNPNASSFEIIDPMLAYLKKKGYDSKKIKYKLLPLEVQPVLIDSMISLLKKLKQQGYILIGATNQSYYQNTIYRSKLKNKNFDLVGLFDAILTTYSDMNGTNMHFEGDYQKMDATIYMANKNIRKPYASYYAIIKELAKMHDANIAIFIDDLEKNVQGALKVGLNAVQYKIPTYRPDTPAREFLDQLDQSTENVTKELEKKLSLQKKPLIRSSNKVNQRNFTTSLK